MTAAFVPAPVRRTRAHGARPLGPTPTRARVRHDERTYRRRRLVVGTLAAAVVVLGGVAADAVLAGPGGVPASAAGAQPAPLEVRIVARPGDTMWSIAERFHGPIALDRYLEALISRNGGPSLRAGQTVVLP